MTVFCLEMRSTQNWEDVRYREYTISERKADLFKQSVPKIKFTDSAHHIIPVVSEHSGPRKPRNMILQDHVVDALKATAKPTAKPKPMTRMLEEALRPFVVSYCRDEEPIGDSDLDDEQPRSVHVTLGDCRRARRAIHEMADLYSRLNGK